MTEVVQLEEGIAGPTVPRCRHPLPPLPPPPLRRRQFCTIGASTPTHYGFASTLVCAAFRLLLESPMLGNIGLANDQTPSGAFVASASTALARGQILWEEEPLLLTVTDAPVVPSSHGPTHADSTGLMLQPQHIIGTNGFLYCFHCCSRASFEAVQGARTKLASSLAPMPSVVVAILPSTSVNHGQPATHSDTTPTEITSALHRQVVDIRTTRTAVDVDTTAADGDNGGGAPNGSFGDRSSLYDSQGAPRTVTSQSSGHHIPASDVIQTAPSHHASSSGLPKHSSPDRLRREVSAAEAQRFAQECGCPYVELPVSGTLLNAAPTLGPHTSSGTYVLPQFHSVPTGDAGNLPFTSSNNFVAASVLPPIVAERLMDITAMLLQRTIPGQSLLDRGTGVDPDLRSYSESEPGSPSFYEFLDAPIDVAPQPNSSMSAVPPLPLQAISRGGSVAGMSRQSSTQQFTTTGNRPRNSSTDLYGNVLTSPPGSSKAPEPKKKKDCIVC